MSFSKSLIALLVFLYALGFADFANAQRPLPGGTITPPVWELPRTTALSERKGKFLEFGNYQTVYFDFALENDVVSKSDDNYTHGLAAGINFQGDWGKWRIGYDTRLFTDHFKLDPNDPLETEKTRFIDRTHFDLMYESRPTASGFFYRLGPGLEVYTDQETIVGGQFHQKLIHPLIGSRENDYVEGDVKEVNPTLTSGLGFIAQNDEKTLYCRVTGDIQANVETDRSYLNLAGEVGWTLWKNSDRRPIFELIGSAQCTQYLEDDRMTSISAMARFTIPVSNNFRVHVMGGAVSFLEEANDIFLYTGDGDMIGLASIMFSVGQ